MKPPADTGQVYEERAARWLERHGLKLITRNWRCRFGEIDLIMQDGSTVVFVEVRQRSSSGFGDAATSITSHKRERLQAAARQYLAGLRQEPPCRFDAVLFDGPLANTEPMWLKNIFD